MKVEFQTSVTEKDLMDFKLYHNYHSFSGIVTLLFGIIALSISVILIAFYSESANVAYILLTMFFGLYFTIYTPIGMYLSVKKQIKKVKAFSEPVNYEFSDDKIVLTQDDITEELLWSDIYKVKSTGKNVILYLTAIRANVIPFEALKGCEQEFVTMLKNNLKPFQVKIKERKLCK